MTEKGYEEAFRDAGNVSYLDLYDGYIKIYQSVFLRFIYFTVHMFYHINYY